MATFDKNKGVSGQQKARIITRSMPLIGALQPLSQHSGVMFPYTPMIQVGHSATYGTYELPHSVYQTQYWTNTPNPSITLTAQFSANTENEAVYAAAVIQFFKAATKGDFGVSAENPGAPPPVLEFSAYGALHFNKVPVVVRSFDYTLPEDTDFVTFKDDTLGEISVPTLFQVQLGLGVQIAPVKQKRFNLRGYTTGAVLRGGGWL